MLPAYKQPDARLDLLDSQGVQWAILLPTFGVSVEEYMADDVEQTYANLRAFNRWLEDDWGYVHRDRLFTPPLPVAAGAGARHRGARPGARSRGPHRAFAALSVGAARAAPSPTPYYDPFWARLNEAQIPVAFHISDLRYGDLAVRMGDDPGGQRAGDVGVPVGLPPR